MGNEVRDMGMKQNDGKMKQNDRKMKQNDEAKRCRTMQEQTHKAEKIEKKMRKHNSATVHSSRSDNPRHPLHLVHPLLRTPLRRRVRGGIPRTLARRRHLRRRHRHMPPRRPRAAPHNKWRIRPPRHTQPLQPVRTGISARPSQNPLCVPLGRSRGLGCGSGPQHRDDLRGNREPHRRLRMVAMRG